MFDFTSFIVLSAVALLLWLKYIVPVGIACGILWTIGRVIVYFIRRNVEEENRMLHMELAETAQQLRIKPQPHVVSSPADEALQKALEEKDQELRDREKDLILMQRRYRAALDSAQTYQALAVQAERGMFNVPDEMPEVVDAVEVVSAVAERPKPPPPPKRNQPAGGRSKPPPPQRQPVAISAPVIMTPSRGVAPPRPAPRRVGT